MGRARADTTQRSGTTPRIVIIGAGIAGILMGIKLRQRGWTDFTILEKADRLGGTWRENQYPGAACDVPAHLYVYSFAPNPAWRTRYAKAPEIWQYYHDQAERNGVLPHIEYGKEVATSEFDGTRWNVTTREGEHYEADVVIAGVGRLHQPNLPDITGAERFTGPKFHSSCWDHSVELKGKRLGVIGGGSSGVQIVSALADEVGKLSLFQRTPQWVFPLPDAPIPLKKRLLYRLWPGALARQYRKLEAEIDDRAGRAALDASVRAETAKLCNAGLAGVRDPELRAKLTPHYEVGCKRLVISGSFYDAIQKPSVDLVTEGIDHIEERGVVTTDGKLHEVDALVFATGFKAHAFLRPMQLKGEGGVTLDEVWNDLPINYRTVAIPHMPNFFMLNGPYSPGGSASVVGIIEVQTGYLLQLLDRIAEDQVLLTPREDATSDWLSGVRDLARQTVWATGGCNSWYLDKTGTPAYNPISITELKSSMATPIRDDFIATARETEPA
ncbi:MAG: NAD(P)/FAD-dependent oxidoreductase [Novosphingobium sp.]|nr:NAD(P)/FAD-dependent oxidoreductase [Novosphingobium sp.]